MKITTYYIAFIFLITIGLLGIISCNKISKQDAETGKLLVKVNNSNLYDSDVSAVIPNTSSKSDSLALVKAYLKQWANNEIFYQQALKYLSEEEQNVDKELDAYKKELISFKFQSKLINDKLDTLISDAEIEDYYNANSQNFLLKNNIVKALYVKTPVNIPNLEKLKKLCYSSNPKDAEQLNSLCLQYANNYFMNNNTWLMFDDLKKEINQLKEVPDYSIEKDKTFEFTDATSFYFLKIIDVKSKNTLSPLNFEKKNIKDMIINQRKEKLISGIKKDFYNTSVSNKELIIYN